MEQEIRDNIKRISEYLGLTGDGDGKDKAGEVITSGKYGIIRESFIIGEEEDFESWLNLKLIEINALNGEFDHKKIKKLDKLPVTEVYLRAYLNLKK